MKANFIATTKPTRFKSETKVARHVAKKDLQMGRKVARNNKQVSFEIV